jgi:predicted metal-dependent hydrolase
VIGPAGRVIQADGRSKAYRPLPRADRAVAVREGLEAYERGDFFLAHELLEPAWMGTDDLAERALIQGLIKLAAADVHGVRGNPAGVARNLDGALERLRQASTIGSAPPDIGVDLDLAAVIAAAERRLELATSGAASDPVTIIWRPV